MQREQKLSYTQEEVKIAGHSIEVRINAEKPKKVFVHVRDGYGASIFRLEKGCGLILPIYSGYAIPPFYDSIDWKNQCVGKEQERSYPKKYRVRWGNDYRGCRYKY